MPPTMTSRRSLLLPCRQTCSDPELNQACGHDGPQSCGSCSGHASQKSKWPACQARLALLSSTTNVSVCRSTCTHFPSKVKKCSQLLHQRPCPHGTADDNPSGACWPVTWRMSSKHGKSSRAMLAIHVWRRLRIYSHNLTLINRFSCVAWCVICCTWIADFILLSTLPASKTGDIFGAGLSWDHHAGRPAFWASLWPFSRSALVEVWPRQLPWPCLPWFGRSHTSQDQR